MTSPIAGPQRDWRKAAVQALAGDEHDANTDRMHTIRRRESIFMSVCGPSGEPLTDNGLIAVDVDSDGLRPRHNPCVGTRGASHA